MVARGTTVSWDSSHSTGENEEQNKKASDSRTFLSIIMTGAVGGKLYHSLMLMYERLRRFSVDIQLAEPFLQVKAPLTARPTLR